MKKKPVKVPAGIYFKGTVGNISVHIHSKNGNRLALLKGYNTEANAFKGLHALSEALEAARIPFPPGSGFAVTGLVKPRKKTLRKSKV